MEMFEAFGFSQRVMQESYWVNETTFWRPDPTAPERIVRADRIQDVEDGLSEFPHTILSQARIHDFMLDTMLQSPRRLVPDTPSTFTSTTSKPRLGVAATSNQASTTTRSPAVAPSASI